MRVSLQQSVNVSIYNMQKTYNDVYDLQNKLSSTKRVNKVSDDPAAAYTALRYELLSNMCATYQSNINTADLFMGQTDSALSSMNSLLTEAKDLVDGAANGTNTQDMLDGYAVEMSSLLKSIVTLANTTSAGQYLFAGSSTSEVPFETVGNYVYFSGNDEDIQIESANGIFTTINTSATDALGNLETTIDSVKLNRRLNLTETNSTPLADLNYGNGIEGETLNIAWTAAFDGLNIDISSADDLYDVATLIEQASITQADRYETTDTEYNYILDVSLNEEGTALVITQYDRSTFPATVVDLDTDPNAIAITCRDTQAAKDLGIDGVGSATGNSTLAGDDLNPCITETTLLSDLENWDDLDYVIYNGSDPDATYIEDSLGVLSPFEDWELSGLCIGENISEDGDLYYKLTDLGTGDWQVDVYNDAQMNEYSRIATATSADSNFVLEPANDSGVTGTVLCSPATDTSAELSVTFDAPFTTTVSVKAFTSAGTDIAGISGLETDDLASNWELHGLEEGISAGTAGEMVVDIIKDSVSGICTVNIGYDDGTGSIIPVATGTLTGTDQGTVVLAGTADYPQISGQVDISCPDALADGTYTSTLSATSNTIIDFTNVINSSGNYMNANISADGTSIEVNSRLSGAYLRISENYNNAAVSGTDSDTLLQLDIQGVVAGFNSDTYGNLYSTVTQDTTTLECTVNIYCDSSCETLVATGTTATNNSTLILDEVDDSGLSGSVYLQYDALVGDVSNLQISAKGLSSLDDEAKQISQINLTGIIPGTTADFYGQTYAEVIDNGTGYDVLIYSDSAKTNLVATGTAATTSESVNISEANGSGVSGSLYLNYSQDDSDIVISSGTTRLSGREREDNIFSAFSDAITAMYDGDVSTLSDLINDFDLAISKITNVRAEIGSTQNMLEMLYERHETNILNYTVIISDAVDLDITVATTEYAAAYSIYQAALQTSSNALSMSLFDYL